MDQQKNSAAFLTLNGAVLDKLRLEDVLERHVPRRTDHIRPLEFEDAYAGEEEVVGLPVVARLEQQRLFYS